MRRIIVAIDGYSSCGKSTIAKQLAEYAGYTYVDTGAMYRAVALALQEGLFSPEQLDGLQGVRVGFKNNHVTLNGVDVEYKIRTLEIGNLASQVSPVPEIRRFQVAQQQAMGAAKGIVMDGRDIGTVVFPDAELKLFLTASAEVRAKRRYDELAGKGQSPVYEEVLADVRDRDYRDTHRAESPLRQAPDAILIDNSEMTREEQMQRIIALFNERIR